MSELLTELINFKEGVAWFAATLIMLSSALCTIGIVIVSKLNQVIKLLKQGNERPSESKDNPSA